MDVFTKKLKIFQCGRSLKKTSLRKTNNKIRESEQP